MYIKCPLNYTGGKYKLLPVILNCIPREIDTFVDLFAGGFNVGININAKHLICNDHNNYIIEFFQYLRETPIEVVLTAIKERIAEYQLSKENADGYLALRDRYNAKKNVVDFFVLTCYSFNHQIRFNNQHQFNIPFGRNRSAYNPMIEKNLIAFSKTLKEKNITFTHKDFLAFDFSHLGKKDLVYCDPPYLITNGSYNDGNRGFKDWTKKEEEALLQLLDRLHLQGVPFLLSNVFYHKNMANDLLIAWSKQYKVTYLQNSYSNCNYHVKEREAKTVEVLIFNF